MTFSEKLKKLRREKGITQNELADAIFISRSMIAKYESGLAYPTRENAEKLAIFFDVELSDLFTKDENVQISLDTLHLMEQIHNMVFYICITACAIFTILSFIPIFDGYKIISGSSFQKSHFVWSLISANTKNDNPITIITVIASIIDVALWLAWKFDKNGKRQYVLFITASILFVIIIFLIVLTFVFAANYTNKLSMVATNHYFKKIYLCIRIVKHNFRN